MESFEALINVVKVVILSRKIRTSRFQIKTINFNLIIRETD